MNCCELPAKLPSFPYTWQKELSNLLCEILEARQNIDCQTVKDCETVTSFNSFVLNGNTLTMSYTDERGVTIARQQDLSSVNANPYTFNNALTNNSNVIQLGGELVKNTEIDLLGFNFILDGENIIFSDYPNNRSDLNPLNFLFTNSNGKLMSAQLEDLQEDIFSSPLSFNNGLTRTGDLVQLGGDLIQPTIIGATNTQLERETNIIWIRNNTSIGDETTGPGIKLKVSKIGTLLDNDNSTWLFKAHTTSAGDNPSRMIIVETHGSKSSLFSYTNLFGVADDIITGSFHNFYAISSNSLQNPTIKGFVAASTSLNYVSGEQINITPENPTPSPSANTGTIEKLIGYLAKRPLQIQSSPSVATGLFTGTIADTYGVYIEGQRGGLNVGATQTNTWGIYQAGSTDVNLFNGNVGIKRNPEAPLHVLGTIIGENSGNNVILSKAYKGSNSSIGAAHTSQAARGTNSLTETYLLNNDVIGEFNFRAGLYENATPWNGRGPQPGIIAYATENHSNTAYGTKLQFRVIPNGDIEEEVALEINHNNKVSLFGALRLHLASVPTFADDTAAGVGGLIAGDIYKKSTGELMIKL